MRVPGIWPHRRPSFIYLLPAPSSKAAVEAKAKRKRVSKSEADKLAKCGLLDAQAVASGWGGIRTPVGLSPKAVFKTAAFDHSATHPMQLSFAQL